MRAAAILRAAVELYADAGYRGTNLLNGDTLLTVFNEDRSTSISTQGQDLSALCPPVPA